MSLHFPTVPFEVVKKSALPPAEPPRPLILVVDDEPLIVETLAAILYSKGFAVLTAIDVDEALEISELMPPELLITDVSMPLMNGFDLAAAVKRIAPDCEVIFFTGHLNLAEMYAEIGDAGEYCVMLTKPIHPANLLEHVYCVLEQRGRALEPANHALSLRLYEYLSSVVRGGEVGLSAWGLTPGAVATRSRAVSLKAPSVFPDSGRDQFSSTAR